MNGVDGTHLDELSLLWTAAAAVLATIGRTSAANHAPARLNTDNFVLIRAGTGRIINIFNQLSRNPFNDHGRLMQRVHCEFVYERRTSEADLATIVWRMAAPTGRINGRRIET
ncbi:hypothetical protein [Bradyrhizobium sp. 192]|uniref:hypothetical protein n=1 Tax=Bradyrhizobium sp. 192 TaxID=2782660 RepID=UPI001FFE3EC4|nr:hypothetical protein [Bradyrhizobium sp. 192]UPJ56718.1 hypothetical protein IVB24_29545 [Bradyrhizobium sp. 192]